MTYKENRWQCYESSLKILPAVISHLIIDLILNYAGFCHVGGQLASDLSLCLLQFVIQITVRVSRGKHNSYVLLVLTRIIKSADVCILKIIREKLI